MNRYFGTSIDYFAVAMNALRWCIIASGTAMLAVVMVVR